MMGKGYLDEMGEYCEYGSDTNAGRKTWDDLTYQEQEVIKWCKNWAKLHNHHVIQRAERRRRWINKFLVTLGYSETPKKQEAYKICFENFKAFKKFVNDNQNI